MDERISKEEGDLRVTGSMPVLAEVSFTILPIGDSSGRWPPSETGSGRDQIFVTVVLFRTCFSSVSFRENKSVSSTILVITYHMFRF